MPRISKSLRHYFSITPSIQLFLHPICHIAGAFYPSGFSSALGLSIDGSGDKLSVVVADCSRSNGIKILAKFPFDNSIGDLYAAVTERLGFHRADGEFKVMGMAAYGTEDSYDLSSLYELSACGFQIDKRIYSSMGSKSAFEVFYDEDFFDKLKLPKRHFNQPILQDHFDLARSVQVAYQNLLLHVVDSFKDEYSHLVFSGGCALNCLANKSLVDRFEDIYIMPAASDRGLSLGAGCLGSVSMSNDVSSVPSMLLGLQYSNSDVIATAQQAGISCQEVDPVEVASQLITDGKVIGWFQGRSEFGPRALGARSVLANSAMGGVKNLINSKIKFREDYRPFAPALLSENLPSEHRRDMYNYMNIAPDIIPSSYKKIIGEAHNDGSARIQRVTPSSSPIFSKLLSSLNSNGVSSVINTSFNLNGEPIVESPRDAIRTFYSSSLDALVIGDFLFQK